MSHDSSATPHTIKSTKHLNLNGTSKKTISDALKRRAQSLTKDKSIDAATRAFIRYGLEINDPWLPEMVRRADAGEPISDNLYVPPGPDTSRDDSIEEKIAALAEMICRAGDEPETKSAALLMLMAMLENAKHPKALANQAKHFCLYSLR